MMEENNSNLYASTNKTSGLFYISDAYCRGDHFSTSPKCNGWIHRGRACGSSTSACVYYVRDKGSTGKLKLVLKFLKRSGQVGSFYPAKSYKSLLQAGTVLLVFCRITWVLNITRSTFLVTGLPKILSSKEALFIASEIKEASFSFQSQNRCNAPLILHWFMTSPIWLMETIKVH